MANLLRQQLREAVATVVTGLAATGARVYQSRAYDLAATELPALLVYTLAEQAQPATVDGSVVERQVELQIDAVAKVAADIDDMLDTIAKQVEAALGSSVTVGGARVVIVYQGADIELDVSTDMPVGVARLRYLARLFTTAPDTLINA